MTDPTYGDNPIDLDDIWYRTMRPALVNDPEIDVWRVVFNTAGQALLDSSWLVRWRVGSVVTAEGVHLDAAAKDVGFIRPDGWDDDRYRAAAIPIEGAALSNRPPSATEDLADGLAQGSQTWLMTQGNPLEYVVIFFELDATEAGTYRTVLEYGRSKGVRFVFAHSQVAQADTFTFGISQFGGPDVLADIV